MKNKGFTLVELLAVIVVLGIIALIGYTSVGSIISSSKESSNLLTIKNYVAAVEQTIFLSEMNNKTVEYTSSWLQDNVKFENSKVICENFTYNKNTSLYGCKINDSIEEYCYSNNESFICEKSRNLFDASSWNTITKFGITIEYLANEDCFLINGTVPDNKDLSFVLNTYQIKTTSKSATYTISTKYVSGTVDRSNAPGYKYAVAYFGKSDDGSTYVNWHTANLEQYDTSASSIPGTNYIYGFWFYISPGVSFDNYKVKIQLEEGSVATEYEPYGYKK